MSKPRQIVYPGGHAYAGPEPTTWQRVRDYLWQVTVWTVRAAMLVAGSIGGVILALEFDTLSGPSRLWCGGGLLVLLAVYGLLFHRHRKVRN